MLYINNLVFVKCIISIFNAGSEYFIFIEQQIYEFHKLEIYAFKL